MPHISENLAKFKIKSAQFITHLYMVMTEEKDDKDDAVINHNSVSNVLALFNSQ